MVHFPSVMKTIPLFSSCFLILTTLLCDLAHATPPYWTCSKANYYADNSPFHKNLGNLLTSLPSNASVSEFYTTSTGDDPDRVYGLYMCLDYVSNEDCHECINMAQSDITTLCPGSKEAVLWEEMCLLRYSNENFFGRLNVADNIADENLKNISDPKKFESVVSERLSSLAKQAAYNNVSAHDEKVYYADGEVGFEDKTIYFVVQCTRDMSGDECDKCLARAREDVLRLYYFSIGARLMSRSCFLRYEFYAFHNGASESNTSNKDGSGRKIWLIVILTVVSACLTILLLGSCVCLAMRKRNKKRNSEIILGKSNINALLHEQNFQGRNDPKAQEYPYISLASILAATANFSDANKLGEGGFGPVYKGTLSDGNKVAIKRLSSCSEQGSEEFTNEVMLIMKLQHKNLVRLSGFCIDGDEKLLAYEYMPNGSLDVFLYDSTKRAQLAWRRRTNIIIGIARGILYLHQDSRLRIIHRDLKASNVLLDNDMNPKISDFGMARIFEASQGEANTAKIVGTYGYMAPEYAMEGLYSVKSDVYAFGVLLLTIITGRRNAGFQDPIPRAPTLITYAWLLWNEGRGLELMDPLLVHSCDSDEFLRHLHIGLLCVQEDANDRPTMSSILVMLKNQTVALSKPQKPAFSTGRFAGRNEVATVHYHGSSNNGVLTVSTVAPQ